MAELDRIRWHCRRGLLELDLVLERFNRRHLATLDPEQLRQFKEILDLPDTDLLDLVMGRIPARDRRYNEIVQLLQAV